MPLLHWLNKDTATKAAARSDYRLLQQVPELSYGDSNNENLLIQGDNLEALKALLPFYAGKVKCIYVDPPFNTEQAFEHYDDNVEHSVWLSLLYPRLELLRELLSEDGVIFLHIIVWRQLSCPVRDNYDGRLGGLTFYSFQPA